jgi:hypothetical protein
MSRWFVNPPVPNPYLKETSMARLNPKHRKHHRKGHHRHHRNAGIPWHVVRSVPRYRRNPNGASGMLSLATHPMQLLKDGAIGALSTYATIVVPNAILPFPGTDLTAKALRLLTRAVWGGILHTFGSKFLPGSGPAILTGAMIGAGGGFVFDLFGFQMIVGQTDASQTAIIPTFSMPSLAGYGRHHHNAYGLYTGRQPATAGYGLYTGHNTGLRGVLPLGMPAPFAPGRRSYEGR